MTNESYLSNVVTFMQDNMNMNPMTLYCQFTGKPIGRMYQDEIESILDETVDIEEAADDLMIRTLASMRPSVAWNLMRTDSLTDMQNKRPVETLAYLLNRLFQPNDFYKLPLARRLNDLHSRIKLYQYLESNKDSEFVSGLHFMLIEIDAKMNLTRQTIDLRIEDMILFGEKSAEVFEKWYRACIKVYDRNQKLEADQTRWLKGNTLAKPAFFATFMEAKPESKTKAAKRVKEEKTSEYANLFDAVLAEAENDASNRELDATFGPEEVEAKAATPSKTPTFIKAIQPKPTIKPVGVTRAPAFLRKG